LLSANIFATTQQIARGEISPLLGGERLFILAIVIPIMEQAMRSLYRDLFSDDSDEEIWHKRSTWYAAIGSTFLSGVPVVGTLQDMAKIQLIGGHTVTVQDPGSRLVSDAFKAAGDLTKNPSSITEKAIIAAMHASALTLSALDLPGGNLLEGLLNIGKTVGGFSANKETTDEEKDQKYRDSEEKKARAKERKDAKVASMQE